MFSRSRMVSITSSGKLTRLTLKLDGEDADEAARQLVEFFEQGFGEQ